MAEKLKYHAFKRNTLLEELQTILHEYPDNEQIIKELLQNAEDAGAHVVKMGLCTSSRSEHLPDPYKKYLSGPAFCFYNDSVFEDKDWEGITMVRKSNKHDDPLKVGKFGIGFKSVFHITDTVTVISGTSILFIDPLYEEIDPRKVCCQVSISHFVQQDVCGPQGFEALYNFFGINEDTIKEGNFAGTVFYFPLRNSPSNLSENVYTPQKVSDLLASFKKEISSEMLFLTSIEEIGLFKMVKSSWKSDTVVSLDDNCAKGIREERERYKAEIKSIEDHMERDDHWIHHCDSVWMKCTVTFNVEIDENTSGEEWLVINYFHAGAMSAKISNLIRNRRSKYRPYIGIAVRLDQPISCGQIFCFLPLPIENESSTGLPVHVNGFFSLDSNRQHIKWPSHDQTSSDTHLENDMLWNVCMVREILPIVYKELFEFWQTDFKSTPKDLNIFYNCIPRMTKIKQNWASVGKKINEYLLESSIPCIEKRTWVPMRDAYFANFKEDIQQNVRDSVIDVFLKCGQNVVILGEHVDLLQQWSILADIKYTTPLKTRNLLKIKNGYKGLQRSCKEHILMYCCSDGEMSDLEGIELLPLQNKSYTTFQHKQSGEQEIIYLCENEELEILIGKECSLALKDSTEFGHLLEKLASSGYYAFQNMCSSTWFLFLNDIVKNAQSNTDKPMLLRHSSAIFGDIWLAKVWQYLTNRQQTSLDHVQELCLVKTKESDELKKISESFVCETGTDACHIKTLAYFKIWVVDTTFHDSYLLAPGKGIAQELNSEGKSKVLERCTTNCLVLFNKQSTDPEKEWFKEFLPDSIKKSLMSSLRKLNIFKCFSNAHTICFDYTSLHQCDRVFIGNRDFPIQFPTKMIMSTSRLEERLLLELNASKFDLTDCVQSLLKENDERLLKANDDDKRKFCFYVLGKRSELRNWEKIQTLLNKVKFIKNGAKQLYSANELYDPNDLVLKDLFLGEFRFPEESEKNMSLLCNLTFQKSQSKEFLLDIFHTCQNFEKNTTVSKEKKSKALLKILRQEPQIVQQIYTFKIVPFKEERDTNYPKSMDWYTNPETFVSFEMMCSSQYIFIIGSVLPTPKTEWEEFFGSTQPAMLDVIKHFHNIVMCYDEDEHTGYSFMMEKVYQYLARQKHSDFVQLLPVNCVFTEKGFLPASSIYIDRKKSDIDLKPYFIPLPKEYIALKDMFEKFGCKKSQSSSLFVESLNKIEKVQLDKKNESDSKDDLIKAETILKKLSELSEKEISVIKDKIKVPIQSLSSDKLEFEFAKECAYSDLDWFIRTFTEEDKFCLIHPEIDNVTAKKIGVKSLKQLTLSDAEEICSDFGQSEPLTQRLNLLLEEGYSDGLSVPKELIQNADDAGASEVYFLYDERENEDAKSCLLDNEMKECQGPAFWVFNNAVFSSTDFKNIQKLGGASKKQDTTKIGKFGLGFNSVYNLTDLPSFVSGTHLVYLDPHGKYLKDVIRNERNPGIKLNLRNRVMLRKLENQFKPYQNVFGFSSSIFTENKNYEGTLFRFPLRTKHQARTSEISNKEYSSKEMEKLMKQFCRTCGNMILFTQNVRQIKIFHVDSNCVSPDKEMQLVLTVKKENHEHAMNKCENNILMAATQHCYAGMQTTTFPVTVKTKINLFSEGHLWVERTSKFVEETNWIISWAIGKNKALEMFHEKKSDGALPLASVGIPYDRQNDRFSPIFLGERKPVLKKFGFYDTSHIFCFLPMPIKSTLAYHVNGTFAISSDRQRLLTETEDDKEYRKQYVWNDSLLSDATLEAILELLMEINEETLAETPMYNGYELWPLFDNEDCLWRTLQIEFYKSIVQRMLPVFKTHKGYKSFQECIFLHLDIKSDNHLNKFAFDILKQNPLDEKIITEIPNEIYKNLEICHKTYFLEHVVSYERFIIDSFLPNIAKFPGDDYDKIVLEALRSGNQRILTALQASNCISSSLHGLRKTPKHLVHPYSLISGIFLPEDNSFPAKIFCGEKDLDTLVSLGMMKNKMQMDLLLSQAKDVSNLSTKCTECAFLRSKTVLSYISYDMEAIHHLSDIPFLPVESKPIDWPPIQWNNEVSPEKVSQCSDHKGVQNRLERFEKPCKLYFPSLLKLVGCSQPLLLEHEELSFYKDELHLLGVKKEEDIDIQTLKLQINEMTRAPENAQIKEIEDMSREIYITITKRLTDPDVVTFVNDDLPNIPCVVTERKFVYPKQVVFSLKQDCSPYLFGLSPKYADHFTTLMEKVGVRKSFESVDIIDALLEIKNKYDGKQLPPDIVGLVSRLTTLFENCDSIPVDNLHLPDTNGYLCHVNDLCINDFDWIATTESMKILNKTISLKVAEMARIKSKRDQSILNDSEEFGHEFGQHEELTNRINRILDGYPEACILKELLQNADDVGATELHFIKDIRCHGTDHILSDAWKKLQGPALCVYNDSVFTEEDLCGIQNLGIGNKRDDLTCTGQYGVGFNVVYSITDVPSFITRDMENNFDNLCVLDPQRKYIPTSPLQRPGRRFQNASKLLAEKYTDMIPCYLEETGIWKSSRGTLFRFPLRCNNDSLLSQRTVNIDELTDLLNKLKCEIADCLVFLHNVRHVSISTVKEDGLLEREFIVTAEISNNVSKENLHTLSRKVQKEMKTDSLYVCRVDRKEFTYELNVNINGQFIQKWLVVNGFGFMDKNVIPIKVQTAYEEKRLALLPISGVAFSIVNKRLTQTSDELTFVDEKLKNSRVYCFLPLPLQTGLPVLINGHFALDNETRRNIWWDNDENQDLKTCWNKCLIENVILPTYISVFHYLKATLFTRGISKTLWSQLNQFHQVFPCMKNSEGNIWQHLTKTLYTRIAETNCCVFPIVKKMCKDKEISFEKQQENDTETQNYDFRRKKAPTLVTKGDNMEIIWVSLQFGAFPAYFNTISYRYRDDSENCFNENMKPKNSKILSSILKDLGMKIIESPLWIFKSMKDAKVNVQTVSPKAVLEFLKSFRSNLNDKCRIEQVNINVSKTRFRNINWIKQILNYCLKDSNLTALDFQNVPLLVSESLKIHEFVETNQMFLTKKVDLLPFSADKFVHLEQFYMLQSKVFENFVTILGIEDFSDLIVDNIPEEFRQGRIKIWDKEGPCLPNKKWIDSFWDFLSTCIVHIKKEFELKKLRTANTDNEQDDFEHLVAQFCSTLVMYMGNCSFLPVKYADKTYKLYPLNKGKYVLKILPKLNCPEQSALKQLNVPIFDDDDLIYHGRKVSYPENILEISIELLATVDNVQDILDCLYFNRLNLNLEKNACMKMLLFFVRHYEILKETTDCRKKLRCLPFYCGLADMFMTLSEEDIDVIVVPKKMPLDGLVEFGQNISLVFIKHNDIPLSFFEYIGCIAQNPTDMYINHVLPKFNHMPSKAILQHLKFIKDIILPQLKYNSSRENCRKLSSLEDLLQNIAFIPVRRGGLAKASDFFNPRKEIFKIENQLCCLNELPPTPFDEEDWEEFLVHCGMKSEMTPDIFVNFVKRLERLSNAKDFSDIVRKNSKQMVRILFDNLELHENYSFLQHIANAKFLTPHEIQQDYLTLALKSNLRFERKSRLLCFRGSTLPVYEDLVWTKLEIISKDITDNMRTADINVAVDRFGLLSIPPLSCVLDHTKNVCNALEDKIKDICTEKSSIEITVTKMMSKIYTFLQEHACFDSVYILKSIPFIFIKERKMLVKPENVVLDIREHEEIPPYLYKASTCFENFFPVFEGHGAAKSLTCNHLAHILSKIWKKSKHEILHQNDRSCIEKAIKILFAKLDSEKADDFNVPVLYLLSKSKSLVKSNELVFTDDRLIEDRIGNDMPDIEFFIECDVLGMKIYDPLSIINKLPENHRPRLLSKVVLEQLDSECKTAIISSDYAKKLQTFLRSPSFFFGVCRLIRDELYQNGNSFSEEHAIEIQKRLQSVEVKCVEKLKTIMTFEGKVLPNTIKRKTVFSTTESDHIELTKLIIYFDANGTVNNSTWLKSLNVFLGKPLKDNHIHLLDILRYIKNPNGMERELDSLDICSSRDNRLTLLLFMPELGNVVPTDLHYLLDYSCTYIASEEYVAYEIFDHVIDEEYDFDTESEYILAKVIEINGRKDEYPIEDFWTISYLIDIGSGQRIPVEASKLYKFIKNKIVTGNKEVVNNAVVLNWNFDEIKNYITNVLRSAFERGNREFKRILKRLLLQYHPDKHLENKENLQELTLFIEFVNRELENRQSFDNEAMCMFDPNEVFPKSQFTTNVYQLGEIHGVNRINCVSMEEQSGSNLNDFFGPLKLKGSQPEQAKIWFRQAEYDFQASTSDKSQQGAYNWACYKCHQSAEKALKALQFQIDADQVVQIHRLPALTSCINDSELSGLAFRLEGVTGNYFQMRYPDAVPSEDGMRVPSEVYNAAQAEEAIDLAEKILECVRSKLPNL